MRAHLLLATLAACAAAAAALNLSAGQRCANTGARKAALKLPLLLTRTAVMRNRWWAGQAPTQAGKLHANLFSRLTRTKQTLLTCPTGAQ